MASAKSRFLMVPEGAKFAGEGLASVSEDRGHSPGFSIWVPASIMPVYWSPPPPWSRKAGLGDWI